MKKSYFAILGVSTDASPEEIRSAYRRLAKVYHPDHFEGDSEPFKRIQEAYAVLSDSSRRREYRDRLSGKQSSIPVRSRPASGPYHHSAPEPLIPGSRSGPVGFGSVSSASLSRTFSSSFDEIFDRLQGLTTAMSRSKSRRLRELTLEVPLTRAQARRGGSVRVMMMPARMLCRACRGSGGIGGFFVCKRCGGQGEVIGEIPVSVSFPPGLTTDRAVVVPLDRFGMHHLNLTVLFRFREE